MRLQCECGYTTTHKNNMRRHLNKTVSCVPGKDMKSIDVNTLIVDRIYEDLSGLTDEEKKERNRKQSLTTQTNKNLLGRQSIKEFAKRLLSNMHVSSLHRKHAAPSWTTENIITMLEKTPCYIVSDTILGDLEFPMVSTNGYFNTASFDRINDELGYSDDNIELRPRFLNTAYKLRTQDVRDLIQLREQRQSKQELLGFLY
jgi:hypothetical protein